MTGTVTGAHIVHSKGVVQLVHRLRGFTQPGQVFWGRRTRLSKRDLPAAGSSIEVEVAGWGPLRSSRLKHYRTTSDPGFLSGVLPALAVLAAPVVGGHYTHFGRHGFNRISPTTSAGAARPAGRRKDHRVSEPLVSLATWVAATYAFNLQNGQLVRGLLPIDEKESNSFRSNCPVVVMYDPNRRERIGHSWNWRFRQRATKRR